MLGADGGGWETMRGEAREVPIAPVGDPLATSLRRSPPLAPARGFTPWANRREARAVPNGVRRVRTLLKSDEPIE